MPARYKDIDSVVAEIIMTKANCDGAILLLEGPSDYRFWESRIRKDCEPIIGEGKRNILGCIPRLRKKGIEGVLGLVDSDFDVLLGCSFSSDYLVVTDYYDLECILIRSSAFRRVLAEFGDRAKIRKFEIQNGTKVVDALIERALIFGKIRLAARMFDIDLIHSNLSVNRFVERDTWDIGIDALYRAVIPSNSPLTVSKLRRLIAKLNFAETFCVVNGHDIIAILRIGLISVLGSNKGNLGIESIARILRTGISQQELASTDLWKGINNWEKINKTWKIL